MAHRAALRRRHGPRAKRGRQTPQSRRRTRRSRDKARGRAQDRTAAMAEGEVNPFVFNGFQRFSLREDKAKDKAGQSLLLLLPALIGRREKPSPGRETERERG